MFWRHAAKCRALASRKEPFHQQVWGLPRQFPFEVYAKGPPAGEGYQSQIPGVRQVEMQPARLSGCQLRLALRRISELNVTGTQTLVTSENIAQYSARSHKSPALVFHAKAGCPGLLIGVERSPEGGHLRFGEIQRGAPNVNRRPRQRYALWRDAPLKAAHSLRCVGGARA